VDAVITHSAREAEWLAREAPGVRVHVVPWSVRPWPRVRAVERAGVERRGVLLVANFAHAPNLDGAVWLVAEVMPLVWAEQADMRLTIAGGDLPVALIPKLIDPRVRLLGHVPDLAPVYGAARLAAAPLRFGAGLKGKVLEAWAAGLPCAMTPIAAEGFLQTAELLDTVADGAAALARLIVALHADTARAKRAARAGHTMLRSQFSHRQEDAALASAIAGPVASVRSLATAAQ